MAGVFAIVFLCFFVHRVIDACGKLREYQEVRVA